MLDQSFSTKNFRKIFDLENRKGNYLEGVFFPGVKAYSQKIQSCVNSDNKCNTRRSQSAGLFHSLTRTGGDCHEQKIYTAD